MGISINLLRTLSLAESVMASFLCNSDSALCFRSAAAVAAVVVVVVGRSAVLRSVVRVDIGFLVYSRGHRYGSETGFG
jgi:hypothetical protein